MSLSFLSQTKLSCGHSPLPLMNILATAMCKVSFDAEGYDVAWSHSQPGVLAVSPSMRPDAWRRRRVLCGHKYDRYDVSTLHGTWDEYLKKGDRELFFITVVICFVRPARSKAGRKKRQRQPLEEKGVDLTLLAFHDHHLLGIPWGTAVVARFPRFTETNTIGKQAAEKCKRNKCGIHLSAQPTNDGTNLNIYDRLNSGSGGAEKFGHRYSTIIWDVTDNPNGTTKNPLPIRAVRIAKKKVFKIWSCTSSLQFIQEK